MACAVYAHPRIPLKSKKKEREWISNLLLRKLLLRENLLRILPVPRCAIATAGCGLSFWFSSDCCFTGQSASTARPRRLPQAEAGVA